MLYDVTFCEDIPFITGAFTCTDPTSSCSSGLKMGSDSLKRSPLREQQQKNGPSLAGEMTLQRRNGAGFGSKEPSSRKRYDSEDLSPNSTEMFSDEGDSFLW